MENFYTAGYGGSKQMGKPDVPVADGTGFSDAVDDCIERGIDLNKELISNKPSTFFMRVNSEAMINAGIYPGDVVIIDRSVKALSGKVVIAVLNGEMLIRRFEKIFNKMRLIPDTNKLAPIEIDPSCEDFCIWGVVTYVIHQV